MFIIRITRALGALAFCALSATQAFSVTPSDWSQPDILNGYAYADNAQVDETVPTIDTDSSGTVVSLWKTPDGGLGGARSDDSGNTWAPLGLPADAATSPITGYDIVFAGNSTWLSMWTVADPNTTGTNVYLSRSADNGRTWSASTMPYPGEIQFQLFWSSDAKIDLAADKMGSIIATFQTTLLTSRDYGNTWSYTPPKPPSIGPAGSGQYMNVDSRIASAGDGVWMHVYYRLAVALIVDHEIGVSTSRDNGATWEPEQVVLYKTFAPGLALGDVSATGNNAVIVYQISEDRVTYTACVAASTDAGVTWNTPQTLREFAQPLTGLSIASGQGQWLAALSAGGDVLAYHSSDIATTWTASSTIANAVDAIEDKGKAVGAGDGSFMAVFQTNAKLPGALAPDFDIKFAKTSAPAVGWSSSKYVNAVAEIDLPRIEDTGLRMVAGDHGTVVAAWVATVTTDTKIIVARSTDSGLTFPFQQPLQTDFETETDVDSEPQIFYNGEGRWLAVWRSGADGRWGKMAFSTDNAQTWSAPRPLSSRQNLVFSGNGHGTVLDAEGTTTDGIHINRSTDGGQSWNNVSHIAGDYAISLIHSGGTTWYMITAGSDPTSVYGTYMNSTDDGETWTTLPAYGPLQTSSYSQIASDHQHRMVALITPGFTSGFVNEVQAITSLDNGVTWTTPVVVQTSPSLMLYPWHSNAGNSLGIAWAGGHRWAAVWQHMSEIANVPITSRFRAEMATSEDGGLTWSAPERVTSSEIIGDAEYNPKVTTSQGRIIIGWQRLVAPDAPPHPLGFDTDLMKSVSSRFVTHNAAVGWSLYP